MTHPELQPSSEAGLRETLGMALNMLDDVVDDDEAPRWREFIDRGRALLARQSEVQPPEGQTKRCAGMVPTGQGSVVQCALSIHHAGACSATVWPAKGELQPEGDSVAGRTWIIGVCECGDQWDESDGEFAMFADEDTHRDTPLCPECEKPYKPVEVVEARSSASTIEQRGLWACVRPWAIRHSDGDVQALGDYPTADQVDAAHRLLARQSPNR